MDVISMSQSGIENVVASSGTSLTQGQTRLIHRFTDNVTVIYDSDAAGIKASLRGIDILLAEGLDIKVLLLPDGDDPDSFAQTHTTEEVEAYMAANEVDFIRFKTDILLKDAASDPIARAKAVANIVGSIAVIPEELKRNEYIRECSQRFLIDDAMLTRQVAVARTKRLEQLAEEERRRAARESISNPPGGVVPQAPTPATDNKTEDLPPVEPPVDDHSGDTQTVAAMQQSAENQSGEDDYRQFLDKTGKGHRAAVLAPQERALMRLVLKYGMLCLGEDYETDDSGEPIRVIDYVAEDLDQDGLGFENPDLRMVYEAALELRRTEWDDYIAARLPQIEEARTKQIEEGRKQIAATARNMEDIRKEETLLAERADADSRAALVDVTRSFLQSRLLSHPDDTIRQIASDLIIDRHQLSKIYTKNNVKMVTDEDRLDELVPRTLLQLKYDMARCFFNEITVKIKQLQQQTDYDLDAVLDLMRDQQR